jgi:hypothetical protein
MFCDPSWILTMSSVVGQISIQQWGGETSSSENERGKRYHIYQRGRGTTIQKEDTTRSAAYYFTHTRLHYNYGLGRFGWLTQRSTQKSTQFQLSTKIDKRGDKWETFLKGTFVRRASIIIPRERGPLTCPARKNRYPSAILGFFNGGRAVTNASCAEK